MQPPPKKPSPPRQLPIAFDSTRLEGMSGHDRRQAVTCLAMLLTEACEAADRELADDDR
jgi:hypothetical protein